jgi:hypothetical protein
MVDAWESQQTTYQRTYVVLEQIQRSLEQELGAIPSAADGAGLEDDKNRGKAPQIPQVMLVCGADVLATMNDAKVWEPHLLEVSDVEKWRITSLQICSVECVSIVFLKTVLSLHSFCCQSTVWCVSLGVVGPLTPLRPWRTPVPF